MSTVILFNKPFGVLSQFTPESDHAALDTFGFPPGVYAAGRLDHDSEGALLLTDNGKLIKKLLDPKFEHQRTYLAQVDGQITEEAVRKLARGVDIKGYHTKPCKAEIAEEPDWLWPRNPPVRFRANIPTSWVRLTLIEGKNRQVRHMTAPYPRADRKNSARQFKTRRVVRNYRQSYLRRFLYKNAPQVNLRGALVYKWSIAAFGSQVTLDRRGRI